LVKGLNRSLPGTAKGRISFLILLAKFLTMFQFT
jgi:hypothetical protein